MKIAIPTNDQIFISKSVDLAEKYKVITYELGKIIAEEYRIIDTQSIKSSRKVIEDCHYLVIPEFSNKLEFSNIEIVETTEKILTNIEMGLVNRTILSCSNYTCGP